MHGVGTLGDVVGEVEHLEDPFEGDHGGGEFDPGVGEGGQRRIELTQQRGEHDDRPDREGAVDHQHPAHPEDGRGAEGADDPETGEEPASDHGSPYPQVAHLDGLFGEPGSLVVGTAEQLDEQGAAHVEGLGQDGRHRGVVLHLLLRHPAEDLPHSPGRVDEQRQCRHRQQGEAPFGSQHDHQDGHHRHDVGGHGDEGAGDGVLGADHVVVESRDQLAGSGGGEEAEGHRLQMPVELTAQIEDDPLTRPGRQPSLQGADHGVDQRHRHHAQAEEGEHAQVLVGDGAVDQLSHQQRRDQRQQGDHEDGGDHPRQVASIGAPVAEDPPQQPPIELGAILFFVET